MGSHFWRVRCGGKLACVRMRGISHGFPMRYRAEAANGGASSAGRHTGLATFDDHIRHTYGGCLIRLETACTCTSSSAAGQRSRTEGIGGGLRRGHPHTRANVASTLKEPPPPPPARPGVRATAPRALRASLVIHDGRGRANWIARGSSSEVCTRHCPRRVQLRRRRGPWRCLRRVARPPRAWRGSRPPRARRAAVRAKGGAKKVRRGGVAPPCAAQPRERAKQRAINRVCIHAYMRPQQRAGWARAGGRDETRRDETRGFGGAHSTHLGAAGEV